MVFWTITSSLLIDALYKFYRYSDVFFWILHTSWQTQYTLISLFGVNDSRRLLDVFHYSDDNLKYDAFLNDKQLLLSFGWTYFIYQAKVKHSVTSEFTKAKIYKSDVILTMLLLMTVGFLLLLVTPGGAGWHCFTHFVLMVFVNFFFFWITGRIVVLVDTNENFTNYCGTCGPMKLWAKQWSAAGSTPHRWTETGNCGAQQEWQQCGKLGKASDSWSWWWIYAHEATGHRKYTDKWESAI